MIYPQLRKGLHLQDCISYDNHYSNKIITVGVLLNVGVVLDWLLLEAVLYSFSLLGPEFLVAGRSSEVVASRSFENVQVQ